MGKVRGIKKLHSSSSLQKSTGELPDKLPEDSLGIRLFSNDFPNVSTSNSTNAAEGASKEAVFSNIEIPEGAFNQASDDLDGVSVVSSKAFKKTLTKKLKRQFKHQQLKKKLKHAALQQKEYEEAEKRKKTPIVGDMRPLADALPSLDSLVSKSDKFQPHKDRNPPSKKFAEKQKGAMLDYLDAFKAYLSVRPAEPFSVMTNYEHYYSVSPILGA